MFRVMLISFDNTANRYSAIFDPEKVIIENTPEMKVELNLNPNKKEGGRRLKINNNFLLSKKDLSSIKDKELVRLMDCLNFRKGAGKFSYESVDYSDFKGNGEKIINWLPASGNIDVEVLMPDKKIIEGKAEESVKKLKAGEIIQFLRFGFCRLDKKAKDKLYFWFTHS